MLAQNDKYDRKFYTKYKYIFSEYYNRVYKRIIRVPYKANTIGTRYGNCGFPYIQIYKKC